MMDRADQGAIRARLEAGLAELNIDLGADQTERMLAYLRLLQRWNRVYNLTAVRDPLEMVSKHLLDSLAVLPYLFGDNLLDLGTGAGLPGIPLVVAASRGAFYLLDSNAKKTRFLRQVVMELELENVAVVQVRMDAYLPRRKFATIVSRAVALAPDLLAATGHLLARPGRFLVMKGVRPGDAELRCLEPSPDDLQVHRLEIPFLDGERHLIEVRYD